MTMMIRPVLPHLYKFDVNNVWVIISAALMLVSTVLIALIASRYASSRFGGERKKTALFFTGISFLSALALICFFGCAAVTIKGVILSLILISSSYEDIKKRECSDYLHLMIVIAAFVGTDISSIPNMFVSAMFAGGVMLLTVLITKSEIGGADIKMAAACSFMLGIERGIIGLLAGTVLALIFNIFKKNKKKGFPMIPYLAVGYMAAYFIQV